ncbi:5-formyltetrahydrofolate cyclo-ligase [Nocardia stercoris]|uniref:5-formyltetrahydrofolate cyclo-ligase n=1 Tax=Nocardia stercoris TaxID=2483361 RepID=A0A3M2KT44_9NOCA|nr:5-formyltetrahydrofolate cyclo-ligase [Nocardia stercoris]RMI28104.1 5-formyltetrahydrofolate cyclo-ligase [Nocardia stercoris]
MGSDTDFATWDKARWRAELLAARAAVDAATRAAEASALAAAMPRVLDALDVQRSGESGESPVIAAYVPVGGEPGSLDMLTALLAAGTRVVLPVTGPPGPLRWAEFTGPRELRRARYGLLEPDGPELPPTVLATAAAILVPALAVDERGVRLGRGAGYYDRTLPSVGAGVPLVAVVRDAEVVRRLPEEAHDRRMGWALTPGRGLSRLAAGPDRPA